MPHDHNLFLPILRIHPGIFEGNRAHHIEVKAIAPSPGDYRDDSAWGGSLPRDSRAYGAKCSRPATSVAFTVPGLSSSAAILIAPAVVMPVTTLTKSNDAPPLVA
jgi:hypothetical protein